MKQNMGKLDRSVRFLSGLLIVSLGIIYNSWWGSIGVILLLTSFIGWCPLYLPFRFSTKRYSSY